MNLNTGKNQFGATWKKRSPLQWAWFLFCLLGAIAGFTSAFIRGDRDPGFRTSLKQISENIIESSQKLYDRVRWSLDKKITRIYQLEEENSRLRLENVQFKQLVQSQQFQKVADKEAHLTQSLSGQLDVETGNKIGLILKGIPYRPPGQLKDFQLYTLGIGYLKEREYEKAAVIFTLLSESISSIPDQTVQLSKTLLAAGVAWYRLNNYLLADHYFNLSLKQAQTEGGVSEVQAQSLLWKALAAGKLKKEIKAQYWLNELFEKYPRSAEAVLMNSIARAGGNLSKPIQQVDHGKVSK